VNPCHDTNLPAAEFARELTVFHNSVLAPPPAGFRALAGTEVLRALLPGGDDAVAAAGRC
jgi:hypothetical protein